MIGENFTTCGVFFSVISHSGPITYLHIINEEGCQESFEFLSFDDVSEFDEFIKENQVYCNVIVSKPGEAFGTEVKGQPVRFTKIPGPVATYFVEPEGCSSYIIGELRLWYYPRIIDACESTEKENNND